MSGAWNVRLFLIIFCALACLAECSRPLEDDELSTVILRLLETTPQIPVHLPPPQLSPAQHIENIFAMSRRAPSPIQESNLKSDFIDAWSEQKPKLKVSPRVLSDLNAERLYRQQYTYNSVLHKNPAGPNPIGNDYRPGDAVHDVKRYRYPPQG